ncbi:MAG: hypothetical protein WCO86_18070, partial [Planctomycetota bacterium]
MSLGCLNDVPVVTSESPPSPATKTSEIYEPGEPSTPPVESPADSSNDKQSLAPAETTNAAVDESVLPGTGSLAPPATVPITKKLSREEKFAELLRMAEAGDAESQAKIGDKYYYREESDPAKQQLNVLEAQKWFLAAAEQGSQ